MFRSGELLSSVSLKYPFWNSRSAGFEVIKLFSCWTELSMNLIFLMNVKMSTLVGILTFISNINRTSESFKSNTENSIFFSFFIFWAAESSCSIEFSMKNVLWHQGLFLMLTVISIRSSKWFSYFSYSIPLSSLQSNKFYIFSSA